MLVEISRKIQRGRSTAQQTKCGRPEIGGRRSLSVSRFRIASCSPK